MRSHTKSATKIQQNSHICKFNRFFFAFRVFFRSFPVFSILSLPYPTYPSSLSIPIPLVPLHSPRPSFSMVAGLCLYMRGMLSRAPSSSPFPPSLSIPHPIPIPHSPFPPSLPQYGGWPLFIYAWDVIPRPFPTPSPRALLPPIPILASLPFRLPSCRSRLSSFTPDTIRPPSLAGRVGVRLSICQVYM